MRERQRWLGERFTNCLSRARCGFGTSTLTRIGRWSGILLWRNPSRCPTRLVRDRSDRRHRSSGALGDIDERRTRAYWLATMRNSWCRSADGRINLSTLFGTAYRGRDQSLQVSCGQCLPALRLSSHLLETPPSLAARKGELSTNELTRQIERWDRLRRAYPSSIKIDTVTNTVADAVSKTIAAFRAARKERLVVVARPVLTWPRRLHAHATPGANLALRALYKPASNVGKVRRRLVVKIPRTSHSVVVEMAARAIAEMDLPLDGYAVIRSKDRTRAVVALMREGSIVEFVKIGWGRDALGLKAEARILEELHDTDRVRIPRLLGSTVQDGWSAIRLESLERNHPALVDLPIGKVVDALVALRWSLHGRGVTHGDLGHGICLMGQRWASLIGNTHARNSGRGRIFWTIWRRCSPVGQVLGAPGQ